MSAEKFAKELEAAADEIALRPRADLQILLRRAALRLRNTEAIPFDPDVEKVLTEFAAEFGTSKNEIVRRLVREGLQAMGYLVSPILHEDSETEGNA
jgi:hypothetical protein